MYREPYNFTLERYIEPSRFAAIKEFTQDMPTPLLVMDLNLVERKYDELSGNFPSADIFYAVKANPMPEILRMLHEKGSSFDIASRYELDLMLSLGVAPEKLSFGNTIKKKSDIAYFYDRGVRLFATDSETDLLNIAAAAPQAKVLFRILTEGTGADWPLSRKFGAHADIIYNLILQARDLGLEPYGLSFHVGSQQRDIGQWDDAIARCKYLYDAVAEDGIELQMLNMGGGFPASYVDPTFSVEEYAKEIIRFVEEDFGDNMPQIILEPGRSLVADAGIIVSEVINISRKAKTNMYQWVFIDIGKFGGLIETIDESIKFPIYFEGEGMADEIILAGPTCDSMDILYENFKYHMPENTQPGDRVYIFTTGAYTRSYSSICFNGFPPLHAVIFDKGENL
ncbi:MAG: type III PLP-dependent enzyme [Candidatus Cloacimonadaceae bacterium]|jgi:ornithine decarboxylase|nr:type III PLP-dependent enzyme [Candidatus Cloacimonadota bacterium]MDY0127096.1 type III PLP-dependent enzyme [Candidatus Cloacimonadaceae bacterium]MCB5255705.1 type III PLP-dependent enzyme [Candidatus Cloacimonadota bacterium]MCK9177779.1 type III PLP-dependent enzyme [Candidatus Cloacimonadota bacterium]MCK9241747.1 type III PLP-dependent enzyme [Candidatus Cloacimonadota bacterium]